jgi:type IV secretory pathway VirB10-like protein
MKSQITSMLMSFSFLAATITVTAAQEVQPSPNTVVVESGNDLRCRIEKGLRITKSGEPITAKLVEPVYAGTTLAIPEGSTINGHVSSVSTSPLNKRAGRLLSGDFTPPRTANVTFDQVIFPDGTAVEIHTDTTVGTSDMQTAQYLPKSQRPGIRQKMKDAAKPLLEPNKLPRLRQAAITSLPYHPEYLNQGTVFDATLLDPIQTPTPIEATEINPPLGDNYLHLRLLTALKSEMIARGAVIEAAVSRPYYNSEHVLLYPAGTKLEGTVTRAVAAGWMKKNGTLLFSFHAAHTPDGTTTDIIATVAGIQAAGGQRLAVGLEGNVRATTSLFSRLRAPVSLIGPSRAVADSSVDKTAWSRAGEGRSGFGLLGAGAAQASAATAIGFGYFGAAVKIYDAFLAKGSNVELPVNTPVFLRIDEKAQLSSLGNPPTVVMSPGVGKP